MTFIVRVLLLQFLLLPTVAAASVMTHVITNVVAHKKQSKTPVQLAQVYDQQNISMYLLSEKYDGIRAIWKDRTLRTRNGTIIHAPKWFVQDLPDVWLDGELWYKRGDFEYVASTVTKDKPIDTQWRKITYMVFDAPSYKITFEARATYYTDLLDYLSLSHVKPVRQFKVSTHDALSKLLEAYTKKGAEGLMLQKADAMFSNGRSGNLLKLKPYMDAEARVIAHLPGKGKYKDLLGSLLVRYNSASGEALEFKIGSGFSDKVRHNPPPIGSVVTFTYHGFTQRGVPRFASFLRVYNARL